MLSKSTQIKNIIGRVDCKEVICKLDRVDGLTFHMLE